MLIKMTNPEAKIIRDDKRYRPEKSEVFRLVGDNRKLKRLTSWEPRYNIIEGLKETIEWFKNSNNLDRYKSWLYNI